MKLNVGIIGAGRIGKLHAENLLSFQDVHVKAISDLYIEPIKDWVRSKGIPKVSTNYREILNDEMIDAVLVCAPTIVHAEIIYEAIEAGKHIFCEKPITFDINETYKIHSVVEASNIKFQVGFNRRFDPHFSQVENGVRTGEVGNAHIIKITSRDPEAPPPEYIKSSGGLFMDMTIHDFDMARFLSGSDVEEVFATGTNLVDPVFKEFNDIDTAIITLKFANGAIGVIDNSREAIYGYDQRIEVFGSKGCLQADNDLTSTVKKLGKNGTLQDNPKHFFLERYQKAYICELRAFFDSIKHDTKTLCTINDGLEAERMANAAKKSLEMGTPVKL
ncbi:inositol 2-dehydrogenase [Alteribacter populi]|uniref:inositol 2-dehydrogenase n=1 Tax=Alteribacter populi TaxID=2011011 RepID=UPI000BBAC5C4|nr:inositol 2-dehydrogenase [Alteribacter populi]